MNILLLTQFFSTTKGGGEYVFSIMAKSLADNGARVWVITNKIKGETYPSHKNIKIMFVPPLLEYSGGLPTGFYENMRYLLGAIRKGISIIKNEKIDIIHSNNFSPALAGSILSSLTRRPHIITVHDVFSLCGKKFWELWGKQSNISGLNVLLATFFEKTITKLRYVVIHTVSEATKDDLVNFGAKKPIHVIPNAIEITEYGKFEVKPFQFIHIGRLVFYKNLEVVIKAINIVKKDFPEINLVIVGGGPHGQSLENFVKELHLQDNIRFVGFVSAEEKIKLLTMSQALVFPSLCEGFGLVILEAFAQEKPVLVSNIRPMSDIISNKTTGFVIAPHDEKEWAKAIIEILTNSEDSLRMGRNGKQVLENTYTIENMKNKILQMYENVINRK